MPPLTPPLPDSDSVQGDVPQPSHCTVWSSGECCNLSANIGINISNSWKNVLTTAAGGTLHITQYIARHTLHLTVTISLYTIRLKTQPQHPTHHLYWNITYYKVAVNCQPILKSQNQIMTHAMIIVYFPVLVPQAWPHWAPTVHPSRSDVRAAVWPYSGPWLVAVPRTAGT